jgi:hypothetical protein
MCLSAFFCTLHPFPITGSHLSFTAIGGQGTKFGSQEADPAQENMVILSQLASFLVQFFL